MGFQAHWGVRNSYSSSSKIKYDARNEIYKLNWPRKHHYLHTRNTRYSIKKNCVFSSFFLFHFICSTSPHTRTAKYLKYTQNWSLDISGVPFDSLDMIWDDVHSRRTRRWSSTPAWRVPCLITWVGIRECTDVFLFEGLPEMSKNSTFCQCCAAQDVKK